MFWSVGVFVVLAPCVGSHYGDVIEYLNAYRRDGNTEPYYNDSYFSSLKNYAVNALPVTEDYYPWIARVVHSRVYAHPYMCTAVCVEDRIFITAARCLYSLKVSYTNILYQQTRFSVTAFVVPSDKSKQAFDDIGFLIVSDEGFKGQWATVQLFDTTNRTDDNFNWFADLNMPEDNWDHVVVGYSTNKVMAYKYLAKDEQYNLTRLEVTANINICPEIVIYNKRIKGFHVPCYHSCTVQQFRKKDSRCYYYHGVLGGAIFNTKSNKLLGIATWGAHYFKYELPVGFSVPNSKSFFHDYTCARRIKLNTRSLVIEGYYQALCEDIN